MARAGGAGLADLLVGFAALAAMYLPPFLVFRGVSDWSLYAYWVLVASAYTAYALARLRRVEG